MNGIYENIQEQNALTNPYRIFISQSSGHISGNIIFVSYHWHEYIEMLFVIKGNLEVCANGIVHRCKDGDLIVINSCEAHSTKYLDDNKTIYYVIQFDPSLLNLSSAMYQVKYVLPFINSNDSARRHFILSDLIDTDIPLLINDIYIEYNNKEYAYELAIQSKIMEIFMNIVRIWKNKGVKDEIYQLESNEDVLMMNKVFEYATKHYRENISACDAAKLCNLSYNYFSSKFHKITGKRFKQYLQFVRLMEAERLLVSTDMNITEIAHNTGFSDTSYFISVFRRQKGLSPTEFRKQLKEI